MPFAYKSQLRIVVGYARTPSRFSVSSIETPLFDYCPQNLTKEQADYCVRKMVPYVDPKTGERVPGTLDYSKFVHELFVN